MSVVARAFCVAISLAMLAGLFVYSLCWIVDHLFRF